MESILQFKESDKIFNSEHSALYSLLYEFFFEHVEILNIMSMPITISFQLYFINSFISARKVFFIYSQLFIYKKTVH